MVDHAPIPQTPEYRTCRAALAEAEYSGNPQALIHALKALFKTAQRLADQQQAQAGPAKEEA